MIFWLAHNVLPHERNDLPFGFARRGFFAALDGLIFLSAPSRDLLLAAYPALADQPWLVIPHGHYQGRVATPPSLPRVYPAGPDHLAFIGRVKRRSEEHTSELQSLMRISYAVFCLKKKK